MLKASKELQEVFDRVAKEVASWPTWKREIRVDIVEMPTFTEPGKQKPEPMMTNEELDELGKLFPEEPEPMSAEESWKENYGDVINPDLRKSYIKGYNAGASETHALYAELVKYAEELARYGEYLNLRSILEKIKESNELG